TGVAKDRQGPFHDFTARWRRVLQLVCESELLPFVAAHLVEREDVYTRNVPQAGRGGRGLADVFRVVRQIRNENVAKPDWPLTPGKPAAKLQRGRVVHAGQTTLRRRVPGRHSEKNETDRLEIRISKPVTIEAVGVERGMDAHLLRRGK